MEEDFINVVSEVEIKLMDQNTIGLTTIEWDK